MSGDRATVFLEPYGGWTKNGGVEVEICGKVVELCYGCGGYLDGFVVEVECGCAEVKRRFECEGELRELISMCWERGDRIQLTVGRKSGETREACIPRFEEPWCDCEKCERCGCKRSDIQGT